MEAPFLTSEVDGWIPTGSGLEDTAQGRRVAFLTLKAEGTAPRALPTSALKLAGSVWAGMSGAAVFAGDLLVGVVSEHHLPEGDGSLTVVPIDFAELLEGGDRVLMLRTLGMDSGLDLITARSLRWGSVLPDRPTALVNRPAILAELRRSLLTRRGAPLLLTGTGGAGKSVLATQLARAVRDGSDPELAATYPAGVVWIRVGRGRPIEAAQLELAHAFGMDQPDLGRDWRANRLKLRQFASGHRGLLVLDDVWTRDSYEPFRLDSPGIQTLITTRNQMLAGELGGVLVPVGELEDDQSRKLLASASGLNLGELPREAEQLQLEVGRLALGVAMVGAIAGERGTQSWSGLLTRLREHRLEKIAHRFADDYEHATLLRAIEVAIDDLDTDDQQRWAELAVFAVQADFPEQAVSVLWQPFDEDTLDTSDRIRRLRARSLIQRTGSGRYRLHGLQNDVAVLRLNDSGLIHIHARLADSYARRIAGVTGVPEETTWIELAAMLAHMPVGDLAWQVADDGYLLGHLVEHLRNGGQQQEAINLLANLDWITVSLTRRGLAELVHDYDEFPAEHPLGVVRDTLLRSWRPLAIDPDCLPDQLLGRLPEADAPLLAALLVRANTKNARRPLQIIHSGLEQSSGSLVHRLTGHQNVIFAMTMSSDGTRAITASNDGTAIVWDLVTGTRLHTLTEHSAPIWALAATGDGTHALTASSDGTVILWNPASGTHLHTLTNDLGMPYAVAISNDGTRAITTDSEGKAILWNLATGQRLHTLTGHRKGIAALAITNDNTRVITGAQGGRNAIVWDLATGARLHTLAGHREGISALAVTEDSARLITGGYDGKAIVWDLATGTRLHTLKGHDRMVHAIAVTRDGTRAVTASEDWTAIVWDLATGAQVHVLSGHAFGVYAVALTGDGTRAVTGSGDGTAACWDLTSGEQLRLLKSQHGDIKALAVSDDGARAITAGSDGTVLVWDLAGGTSQLTDTSHTDDVSVVAVTDDGTRAITAGGGTTIVWDPVTGTPQHTLKQSGFAYRSVTAIAFQREGSQAVSVCCDGTMILWDIATGATAYTFAGRGKYIPSRTMAVTRDGTRMIVCEMFEHTPTVWDLTTGSLIHTLAGHSDQLWAATITNDGALAVTSGYDGKVIVWNLNTGGRLYTLAGHRGSVSTLAVTCDGTRVLTGGYDGNTIIWDLGTGERLHTLTGPQPSMHGSQHSVSALAISDDNTRVITANSDGTVAVWELATGVRLHSLTAHQGDVHAIAIASNGTWVVTVGQDKTALVSDWATGQLLATWHGDAPFKSTAWVTGEPIFIIGDDIGAVHILRVSTLHPKDW